MYIYQLSDNPVGINRHTLFLWQKQLEYSCNIMFWLHFATARNLMILTVNMILLRFRVFDGNKFILKNVTAMC